MLLESRCPRAFLRRLSEHDHGVRQVAFSEDEKLLLTISSIRDEGGKMIVWDMSSGECRNMAVDRAECAWQGSAVDHCWPLAQ